MIKKIVLVFFCFIALTLSAQKVFDLKRVLPFSPGKMVIKGDTIWVEDAISENISIWQISTKKRISTLTPPSEVWSFSLESLEIDNDNNLWMGTTYDGLIMYGKETWNIFDLQAVGLGDEVPNIYIDTDTVWFATDNGLGKCVKVGDSFIIEKIATPDENINEVIKDNDGNLWIGLDYSAYADTSLYRYENNSWIGYDFTTVSNRSYINSLVLDNDGNLVIGSNLGLGYLNGNVIETYDETDGLSSDYVSEIFVDELNRIWISYTYSSDTLQVLTRDVFSITTISNDILMETSIASLCSSGNKLFISNYDGLESYDMNLQNEHFTLGYCSWYIDALAASKSGDLWLSTYYPTVLYKKDINNNWSIIDLSLKNADYIQGIVYDNDSTLWVFTDGDGAFKRNGDQWIQYSSKTIPGFVNDDILKLVFDKNNNPWFCTNYNGIFGYVDNSIIELNETNGLVSDNMWDIAFDKSNKLWITYYYGSDGVSVWDGFSFTNYDNNSWEGFSEIYSVYCSADSTVYLTSNKGIYKIKDSDTLLIGLEDKWNGETYATRVLVDKNGFEYFASTISYQSVIRYEGEGELVVPYSLSKMVEANDGNIWFQKFDASASYGLWNIFPSINVSCSQSQEDICSGEMVSFSNTTQLPTVNYAWDVNNDGSVEGDSPEFNYIFNNPGEYEVKFSAATETDTNYTIKKVIVDNPAFAEQIGLVTASENDDCLIVAWEKTKNKRTSHYNIYSLGEGTTYDYLGSVDFDAVSIFKDVTSSYDKTSYTYKITTVNECDLESSIDDCLPHKSIHLVKSVLDNNYSLEWNKYEGATPVSYKIFELTNTNQVIEIDAVPNTNTSYTILNYNQTSSYRVAAQFNFSVNVDQNYLKSDSGPFSQSLSNLSEAEFTNLNENSESDIIAYPSPAVNQIFVSLKDISGTAVLKVTSQDGKIMESRLVNLSDSDEYIFDVLNYPAGTYHITVSNNSTAWSKDFIKQ